MNRLAASIVSILVCGTVLSPVVQGFRDEPVDDFPLSWFPMFARPRPDVESPVYVVAVDPPVGGAEGERHKVDQTFWTAGGFNQGAKQLLVARREGKKSLDPLCERVAKKVRKSRRSDLANVQEIRIFRGLYSRETYFRDGDHTPIKEELLASCEVR